MFADADLSALLKENGHPAPIRIDLFSEIPAAIEHLTPEIPLIWTGGLENHPHTLRQIEIQRPVFGTTSESLQALRSPEKLRSLVIGTGCRLPEMLIHPARQIQPACPDQMADQAGFRLRRSGDSDA
jgi:hypothetical protein